MADPTTFDARLADAFERYLADAPTAVNAAAVAAAVAAPTRRPVRWVLVLAILLLTLALGGAALIGSGVIKPPVSLSGSWTATGEMTTRRHFYTATRLLDDRVLVAGGACCLGAQPSAEIYDPAMGTWSATGPMTERRDNATATLLHDGRVLVAGGGKGGPLTLASAELYDPATGTWSATAPLAEARSGHTATLLPDGRVLVASGFVLCCASSRPDRTLRSAEMYDPAKGTWSAAAPLAEDRGGHTATLLPDGKVLVAGGYAVAADRSKPGSMLGSAEIYDPATGTWSATGTMAEARGGHTATLLPDGNVLVTGGSINVPLALASAEIYEPATGTWSATGTMAEARGGHTATLLPDGRVLVAGGSPDSVLAGGGPLLTLASAELYDPIRRSWTAAASMNESRFGFAAVLLEDGTVLVAGGGTEMTEAELYDPAGLDVPRWVGCPPDPLAPCASATPPSTPAPSAGSTAASNPTVSPTAVQTSAP
jgi:hypothetical protein